MSSYKVGDRGRCPHCNVTVHFTHAQNVSQINWATKAENIFFMYHNVQIAENR